MDISYGNFNVVESLKTFLITVSGEIFNKKLDSGSITTDNNAIKIKNNDNEENPADGESR